MTNLLRPAEIARMRSTVINVSLDMRCDITRRGADVSDDDYGPKPTPVAHLTNVVCHYWEEQDKEHEGDTPANVTLERVVLTANTDVTANDLIAEVRGVDGTVIATGLEILEVIRQINHTVLAVKGVKA